MKTVEDVRALDVREIVARDLGSGRRRGTYQMYRCPFHKDKHPSLSVFAHGWRCHGCGKSGDGIKWVMEYHRLDFKGAMERLAGERISTLACMKRTSSLPKELNAPDEGWQQKARRVIERAEVMLRHNLGARARAYLDARGLTDLEVERSRLGYVPGKPTQWVKWEGLNVPCGILIPWVIDGEVWQLKVRRAAGSPKYQQVAGGSMGGLYGIDRVRGERPVIICEGEFDAMIARQTGMVDAVALGSASNGLRLRWITRLLLAPTVYARLDNDAAGQQALARLRAISSRIGTLDVPSPYKDLNEFASDDPFLFLGWLDALAEQDAEV